MSFEDDYSSVSWDTSATDSLKPEDLLDQVADEHSQDLASSTFSTVSESMFSVCYLLSFNNVFDKLQYRLIARKIKIWEFFNKIEIFIAF